MALAQLFYLREAVRRQARRMRDRWARRGIPRQRSFTLEALESRILLAADLTGLVTTHTLLDPSVPTNSEQVTVRVTNQGNTATNAASQVSVYASLDNTFDAGDVLLGTTNAPNKINAGAFADVNVIFSVPSTLQAGTYKLLARVDATNAIAESNEANNLAIGSDFGVVWQFGAVPGLAGSTTLQLTDGDGTLVTFKISGPGTGMVIQDGTKWDVRVTGTDGTSILTISTNAAGNGRATIDDLFVGGPLKVVNADKVDLTGTFAVLGPLGDATFGSVNGGTIAATTMSGTLQIKGDVQNASILIGANLGQDGKFGGTGADSDSFGAGSLPKLVINGNLTGSTVRIGVDPVDGIFGNGNDVIVGGTSSSLGKLTIDGTMSNSHFFAGSLPATASIGGSTISLAGNPSFGTDVQGPALVAGLTQDTGSFATDSLTFIPSISGTLSDPSGIAFFVAGFGSTPSFNILGDLVSGNFTLSQARLAQINGGTLADGNYTLTLKAIDIHGNSSQIAVLFTLDTAVAQPVFDLTPASDTQTVGDQQTTAGSVSLAGQTEANALVELLGLGLTTTSDATGLFTFTNVSLALGANSLTAWATDTAGNQRTYSRTITRVAAPVIDPITAQTVDEGQLLTFTATASDSDLPAQALTFSLAGTVPSGAAIDANTGVFTWTPTEGQGPNTYAVTVRVTDDGSPNLFTEETIQITVNEVNAAPLLNSIGNQTVDEGQLLTFTAAATDSDVPVNSLSFSLQGTVPAGAAIDPNSGVFTWTPTEAQGSGTFTFDVVVSDGTVTAAETITVTVGEVNAAPVLTAIGNQTIDEGQLLTFMATATDGDLPANTLTYSLANGASGLVPTGAAITAGGAFTWTPTEAQGPGTFTFDVVVSDGLVTDAETIAVTVGEANQTPVLSAIGPQIIDEGQLLTFTATAIDSDLPAQALTFSLAGTVPSGAAIDANTGVFTWTPTEGQGPNTYAVTVRVTDDGSPNLFTEETIQITVNEVNAAPALNAIGNQTVNEGELLTFTAAATDSDLPANGLTFSLQGTVPAGAAIDLNSGAFTWTPTEDQGPNTYAVTVRVTDNGSPNLFDEETIQVTVGEVNAAPLLNPIGNQTVVEGQVLIFIASATDSDLPANSLTFSLQGPVPTGAIIDPDSGVFSWTPTEEQGPNTYSVTVRVTDNGSPNLFAEETIQITVGEANIAPVIGNLEDRTVEDGQLLSFIATAIDSDIPVNGLTFSLQGEIPAGAAIDPNTGALTWTPTPSQVGTHQITVRVTDDGTAALSDEKSFTVVVTASDHDGPVLSAALVNDTGSSNSDRITSDPRLAGNATDLSGVAVLKAGFGPTSTFDVTGDLQPDGSFILSITRLEQINGSPLADGSKTLRLEATDSRGNVSTFSLTFTLDRTAPGAPSLDLLATSDSGVSNTDNITSDNTPTVRAISESGTLRLFINGSQSASVATAGTYNFTPNTALNDGVLSFTASVEDIAGNESAIGTVTVTIDTVAPPLNFDLDAASDTAPIGDQQTLVPIVTIDGQTEPNVLLLLQIGVPFQGLGDVAGGSFYSSTTKLSADGSVVIGSSLSAGGQEGFYWAAPAGPIQGVGDLSGGIYYSAAGDISADGGVVIGASYSDFGSGAQSNLEAFRWTSSTGLQRLGDLSGGPITSVANAVSADGLVIVGSSGSDFGYPGQISGTEAFRWTAGGGMQRLGWIPGGSAYSVARDVSADGQVIVGQGFAGYFQAFRWTASGGMVGLGDLPGGSSESNAWYVLNDGSIVVGESKSNFGVTGVDDYQAFLWTVGGGMVGLGDLPGGLYQSRPTAISADGSAVVGYSGSNFGFAGLSSTQAFRWTQAGGMIGLGDLPGGSYYSEARAVSGDGLVVVGYSVGTSGQEAFIWDANHGMRSLKTVLESDYGFGLLLNGWRLTSATSISADGLVIAGTGINPNGQTEGWRVSLAHPGVSGTADPTGAFTFEGVALDEGANAVRIYATDLAGNRADTVRTITRIPNAPPELAAIGNRSLVAGQQLLFIAAATDGETPVGDLRYSLVNAPAGATIDPVTGLFIWTPTGAQVGTHSFDVVVTDNGLPSKSDHETIQVAVSAVPEDFQQVFLQTSLAGYDLASAADKAVSLDFNGDGRDDLFLYRPGQGPAWLLRSNGDGTFTAVKTGNGLAGHDFASGGDRAVALDFNGDGRDDLMIYRYGQNIVKFLQSNGDATFTQVWVSGSGMNGFNFTTGNERVETLDFNGDGRDDVLLYRVGEGSAMLLRSNGNGTFSAVASGNGLAGYSFTSLYDHALALDFNGDGKDDLLFYRSGSRIAWLNQSNGDGSFTRVMETYDGFVSYDLVSTADFAVSLDVNDDGRDDVWFYRPGAGSQNILFESRGDGTFVSRGFRYGILGYDLASYADMALSLDDNGDGRDDLFIIRPGQGKAFLAHSVVPNVTPVLNAISTYAIEAGKTLTFTASGSDANQPGQTLTYALTGAVPQGASVDPHTGVFNWTPTESQIGVHSFNVVISDDGSVPLSDGQAIQITVNPYVNVAPVLDAIGDKAGAAAQLLTFTATASDSDLPPDTLTYTLDDGSGGAVPVGAVIDPVSGVFSWTPTLAQVGVHTFDVVVTDDGTPSLNDRETITVMVAVLPLSFDSTSLRMSSTSTTITVDWTTNLPTLGTLYVGTTTDITQMTALDDDTNFVTAHSVRVTGLQSARTYWFYIRSVSEDGQEILSGPYSKATGL